MAELHVIDALREKRPELNGIVGHLERQVVHHRASLVHLDAATRLFDLAQYGSVSAVRDRPEINALIRSKSASHIRMLK